MRNPLPVARHAAKDGVMDGANIRAATGMVIVGPAEIGVTAANVTVANAATAAKPAITESEEKAVAAVTAVGIAAATEAGIRIAVSAPQNVVRNMMCRVADAPRAAARVAARKAARVAVKWVGLMRVGRRPFARKR